MGFFIALSYSADKIDSMKPTKIITVEQINGMKPNTERPVIEHNGRHFVVFGKLRFGEDWILKNSLKRKIIVFYECHG